MRYSSRPRRVFAGLLASVLAALISLAAPGCGPEARPAESFTNSVGMEMVKLSSGYYVSKFETRQVEYATVMGTDSGVHEGSVLPVDNITGSEAERFCERLTEMERANGSLPKGYVYSLPTYEQWLEYTADAPLEGSITPVGTPGKEYHGPLPVGSGEVNRLGLYDLRGNVSEYSKDLYNTGSKLVLGATSNEFREEYLDVKSRAGFMSPDEKGLGVGFRCVLVPMAP